MSEYIKIKSEVVKVDDLVELAQKIVELKRLHKEIDIIEDWKATQLLNVHDKMWGENLSLQSLYQEQIKKIIQSL